VDLFSLAQKTSMAQRRSLRVDVVEHETAAVSGQLSARSSPQPVPQVPAPAQADGVLQQQRDVLLQLLQDSALEVQSLKRALADAQAALVASQRHASELAGRLAGRAVRAGVGAGGGGGSGGAASRPALLEFFEACERGDVPHAAGMLGEAPVFVREKDSLGRSCVHFAARGGALPVLRVLSRAGADVRALDHSRRSALSYAARRAGNGSVVAWLLAEHGLDPSDADADGLTPLHHAVLAHSAVAVASLLAAGASTTALDSAGATPLALALHIAEKVKVPETAHVVEELQKGV
jgi:hypothetical protein